MTIAVCPTSSPATTPSSGSSELLEPEWGFPCPRACSFVPRVTGPLGEQAAPDGLRIAPCRPDLTLRVVEAVQSTFEELEPLLVIEQASSET